MRSWVALARWAHLTLALGLLLAVASQGGAAVSIIEFAPESGPVGTTVTIYGTGFSSTPSENSVTFNGTLARVISSTSTEIVTTVPVGSTTGLISATTALGAATSGDVFPVGTPGEPTITGSTPTVAGPETAVTTAGTNFDTPANTGVVDITNVASAGTTSASPTLGIRVPPIVDSGRIAVETPADHAVSSSDSFVPPAPYTEGTQGGNGEAEPEDRSRRLDDPDAGPVMTQVIATVAVLAIALGLQVILKTYGSGLTLQNCRVIIGIGYFANALLRKPWSMNDRENDERAKWKHTRQCEVEAKDTIMMLKRCFEAQYRSLQPDLRALLKLHGADLPFINNPIPAGICARMTALWWTDDLMVRKEQRTFMMVKEDVFLQ
jgi:hypothetical protein